MITTRFFLCCMALISLSTAPAAAFSSRVFLPRSSSIARLRDHQSSLVSALLLSSSTTKLSTASLDEAIQEAKELLCRAADTKLENPDKVLDALSSLETNCKLKFKDDPESFSKDIMDNISGEWRLIFTTGTKERQQKSGGRVNYFPLKAIQKFDAYSTPKIIENGIYAWSLPLIKFSGDFDFDTKKRKLEFDFDMIEILGLLKIKLGRKDVAKLGASTGLGSANNEKLAVMGRRAFFDWISADKDIATARGGGGGLALWKRVA